MMPTAILPTAWYVLLGLFFAIYLALAGYNYGVGLLLARVPADQENDTGREATDPDSSASRAIIAGDPARHATPAAGAEPATASLTRRNLLNAVGPFFLGNEVWLIATAGILLGAFPMLEGELLSGLYPVIGLALLGVLLVTVGVQLRSRPASARSRTGWDRLIITGGALAAFGWGAVLANLLQGVPAHPESGTLSFAGVLDSGFVIASGLTLLVLVTVHGANFLARRLNGQPAQQHAQLARRLIPVALAAVGVATVLGALSDQVRLTVQRPVFAVLLPAVLIVALLAAWVTLTRGRTGPAFAATALALSLPVFLIGAASWPYPLGGGAAAGGLTVAEAAASEPTLGLLTWMVLPLLPALFGVQLICRWMFPTRDEPAPRGYW